MRMIARILLFMAREYSRDTGIGPGGELWRRERKKKLRYLASLV